MRAEVAHRPERCSLALSVAFSAVERDGNSCVPASCVGRLRNVLNVVRGGSIDGTGTSECRFPVRLGDLEHRAPARGTEAAPARRRRRDADQQPVGAARDAAPLRRRVHRASARARAVGRGGQPGAGVHREPRRAGLRRLEPAGAVLGPGSLFSLDGREHLRERRLLLPPFHGDRMKSYAGMIEEEAHREMAGWPEREKFATLPSFMRSR